MPIGDRVGDAWAGWSPLFVAHCPPRLIRISDRAATRHTRHRPTRNKLIINHRSWAAESKWRLSSGMLSYWHGNQWHPWLKWDKKIIIKIKYKKGRQFLCEYFALSTWTCIKWRRYPKRQTDGHTFCVFREFCFRKFYSESFFAVKFLTEFEMLRFHFGFLRVTVESRSCIWCEMGRFIISTKS